MPRQLLRSAAAAGLCVLVTTSAGFAQTAYHRPLSAVSATPSQDQSRYQYPAPATLVGTYHSSDFFPSPLTLTITGMDRYGNLSGSIAGMRSYQPKGQVDWAWETWRHDFGRDGSKASYRDGKVTIVFPNGATYTLDNRGNQLVGTFVADKERSSMTFLKESAGIAAGR